MKRKYDPTVADRNNPFAYFTFPARDARWYNVMWGLYSIYNPGKLQDFARLWNKYHREGWEPQWYEEFLKKYCRDEQTDAENLDRLTKSGFLDKQLLAQ